MRACNKIFAHFVVIIRRDSEIPVIAMVTLIISFFIQVKAVLAELKTNKKIATATHNILAYRYMYYYYVI